MAKLLLCFMAMGVRVDILNIKYIRKFADESPEIAAQIVRNLLRGGDNDG